MEKADKIVVINERYQSEEFVNKRKGIIISDFVDGRSEEVVITLLDKAGNVLLSTSCFAINSSRSSSGTPRR